MADKTNEGQRCGRCRYYRTMPDIPYGSGECRRYAPSIKRDWSTVFDSDWCGDFELAVRVEGAYKDGAGEGKTLMEVFEPFEWKPGGEM